MFPDVFKLTSVMHVLKAGSLSKVKNYKLIPNLSPIFKLFEQLALKVINQSLQQVLIDEQHGFRSG